MQGRTGLFHPRPYVELPDPMAAMSCLRSTRVGEGDRPMAAVNQGGMKIGDIQTEMCGKRVVMDTVGEFSRAAGGRVTDLHKVPHTALGPGRGPLAGIRQQ